MSWSDELLRDCPPSSVQSEGQVLGSLMAEPSVWERIRGKLHAEDFYGEGAGLIFRAIEELHKESAAVDEVSVGDRLQGWGKLETCGGRAGLGELVEGVAHTLHVEHHAREVSDKARARRVIHQGIRAIQEAKSGKDAHEVAAAQAEEFRKLGATNGFGLSTDLWGGEVVKEQGMAPSWIVEPFFAKEDIVFVQADSGVGKTWFLLDMMLHAIAGKEFLGRFMCTPTRWLYCDFDMHPDGYIVKSRLRRLAVGSDLKFAENWYVMTRKHLPGAVNFTTGEGLNVLESTIREKSIDVVVLEVFGALHGAKNENDSAQMEPVMSRARDFAARSHCAIIFAHHTRKRQMGQEDDPASSGRGSTTIKNRADCTIDLRVKSSQEEDEIARPIIVSHVKARYLKQLKDFRIRIEDDSLTGGTKIIYGGEGSGMTKTISKFEKWFTGKLWPEITAAGLVKIQQKDAVSTAVEEGICSAISARRAISEMEKSGIITTSLERLPGHKERQKMLKLVSSVTGDQTGI